MAQSSDSNDSNRNDEPGSLDAEKILDSLIGHMEDSAAYIPRDAPKNQESHSNSGTSTKKKAGDSGAKKTHARADFDRIEKRAAELAAMLGGTGLAYSAAAKKHLDDFGKDQQEEDQQQEELETSPLVVASIHSDDLSMESRSFDFQLDDFPKVNLNKMANVENNTDVKKVEPDELQKQHVSEWQADANADHLNNGADEPVAHEQVNIGQFSDDDQSASITDSLSQATALPIGDVVDSSQVDHDKELLAQADDLVDAPHFSSDFPADIDGVEAFETIRNIAQNVGLEDEKSEDPVPELKDIEDQIDVLSSTFQEVETQKSVEPQRPAQVPEAEALAQERPSGSALDQIALAGVDSRVAQLEAHMVELLGKSTLDEEALASKVTGLVRKETKEAIEDAVKSVDLSDLLADEFVAIANERELQEARMVDSLDALHDALTDLGERMKRFETKGRAGPTLSDELLSTGGGIASSVLGAQLADSNPKETDQVLACDMKDIESEAEPQSSVHTKDELPTWLADATDDLHREEENMDEQQADVFASREVLFDEQTEKKHSAEGELNKPFEGENKKSVLLASEGLVTKIEDSGSAIVEPQQKKLSQNSHEVEKTKYIAASGKLKAQPSIKESVNSEAQVTTKPPVSKLKPKESDFLTTARAAARHANDRIKDETATENAKKEKDGRFFKAVEAAKSETDTTQKSSFIAAAKQKQLEAGGALPDSSNSSLFSNKVEGPNSLLVFTSLILFGTSALLLYGMSQNSREGGATTKVNAVERPVGAKHAPVPTDKKNVHKKQKGAEKPPVQSNEDASHQKRSELEKKFQNLAHKEPKIALAEEAPESSDTLTDYDRMVISGIPGSGPVYTGAALQQGNKIKAGSLFKENVGFSRAAIAGKVEANLRAKRDKAEVLLALASGGNAQAQYEVADRYGNGRGLKKSPAISVEWFEKSAQAGYAPAMYRLATMYERGKGVAKNYNRAMELYKSAAEKGNVKAMHNLAVLYMGGNLGRGDYINAIKWYKKAAAYGVKDSQFNLAIIFHNGLGSKLDLVKAYKWYKLAAQAGDEEARDIADDLRNELSDAQKKRADLILRKWKRKIPDKNANAPQHLGKA